MDIMRIFLVILLAAPLSGCGSQRTAETPAAAEGPVSVEQWRELPVEEKYQPETLERLRASDPELEDERAWSRMMRDVVVPARMQDLPDDFQPAEG